MSDIGIFSTLDLVVAGADRLFRRGLALGAALGAWISPGRRLRGAAMFGDDRASHWHSQAGGSISPEIK